MHSFRTNIVTIIFWVLLTEFGQTFATNGLWDKDERIKFWGQKVKCQGHYGVKYAQKCTFWHCNCHMLAEA